MAKLLSLLFGISAVRHWMEEALLFIFPHATLVVSVPTWRTVKQPPGSIFGVSFDGDEVISPTCLVGAFYRDACVNAGKVAGASGCRFIDQDKATHFGSSFTLKSDKNSCGTMFLYTFKCVASELAYFILLLALFFMVTEMAFFPTDRNGAH